MEKFISNEKTEKRMENTSQKTLNVDCGSKNAVLFVQRPHLDLTLSVMLKQPKEDFNEIKNCIQRVHDA
jgi:hypothetical protein